MNGKRQTIWLVSMLSLMVVLSAYYLFTEDSGMSAPTETAGSIQVKGNLQDSAGVTFPTVGNEGVVVNEVVTEDEDTNDSTDGTSDKAAADTGAVIPETGSADSDVVVKPVKESDEKETSSVKADKPAVKDDSAILKEVASQSVSSSSMFNNYLYEREQKNLKDHNDLLAQITNMDKTPADNAIAQEQLRSLEEKESKINGIEEQLQLKYGEAIVKEENGDNYKVVVLSDKLDVKQAVGIVDLVMKELSVTQDKISVQYVSE